MQIKELIRNPAEYLTKPKKEITEIKFGDIFVGSRTNPPRPDTLRLCVITAIDEFGAFEAHSIIPDINYNAIYQLGGTVNYDDIIEIIGSWDLETITKAYEMGCRLKGDKISNTILNYLAQEAMKPTFIVKNSPTHS